MGKGSFIQLVGKVFGDKPLRIAQEEFCPQLYFKIMNASGNGGLGRIQYSRCPGNTALLDIFEVAVFALLSVVTASIERHKEKKKTPKILFPDQWRGDWFALSEAGEKLNIPTELNNYAAMMEGIFPTTTRPMYH